MSRSGLVVIAVASAAAIGVNACTLYVSEETGSDKSAGITRDDPLQTLTQAIISLQMMAPLLTHAEVCIIPGVYREMLELDGRALPKVTWRALGHGVRLTGGVPVTFQPMSTTDPARTYLPPSVADYVLQTSLPSVGVTDYGTFGKNGGWEWGCAQSFPVQLSYAAGPDDPASLQTWARWPNARSGEYGGDFAYTDLPAGHSPYYQTSTSFIANESVPFVGWRDTGDVYAHGYWWWDWSDQYIRVANFTSVPGVGVNVTLSPPFPPNNITVAARYYLLNSLDALDEAGEFYTNTSSGMMYFLPPNGASSPVSGEVTNLTSVVVATNLSDNIFIGIAFDMTRGTAFSCSHCANVQLINCSISQAGLSGISFDSGHNCSVLGTSVNDTGASGIHFVNGGNRTSLSPSLNRAAHSTVTYFQRACYTYNPGVIIDDGGVIEHNEIAFSPHSGMSLSGNDVAVRYNVVHHTVESTFDNAALYWFPGDWTKWNVSIDSNFWYLNGGHPTTVNRNTQPFRSSVYMDNAGAGLTVRNNVIWQPVPTYPTCPLCSSTAPFAVAINNDGGRSSAFYNNLIVDINGTYNSGGMLTWDKSGQVNSSSYYNGMRAVDWSSGLYAERYPELALLNDYYTLDCAQDWRCPAGPWNNSFTTNILVNVSGIMKYPSADSGFNESNFNITNNFSAEDPGFVSTDPRGDLNFQLKADSPAYAMGFARIAMECFGPWRCAAAADIAER